MNQGNTAPDVSIGAADRFGYAWQTYTDLLPAYEEQFRRWTVLLAPEDWKDKDFLDVGCGMGRNSYWPLTYGARSCIAIDVDPRTVSAAADTLRKFSNAQVRQLSVYEIPWCDRFDIAFSIGVIHHLEFPALALERMVAATKPGGKVLIWVYGRENNYWIVRLFDPLRKAIFSRIPVEIVHHLSIYPTASLWLLLRMGIGRIAYFRLLQQLSFQHLRSIVFDQMIPKIAHYWPQDTVRRLMQEAGLIDVRLAWVNEMSWAAIGTRPTARN
jgi:SAM-dependent methyltransferase